MSGGGTHDDLTGRCRELGLNRNTVRRWMEAYAASESIDALKPKTIRGNMIEALTLLRESFQSLETLH